MATSNQPLNWCPIQYLSSSTPRLMVFDFLPSISRSRSRKSELWIPKKLQNSQLSTMIHSPLQLSVPFVIPLVTPYTCPMLAASPCPVHPPGFWCSQCAAAYFNVGPWNWFDCSDDVPQPSYGTGTDRGANQPKIPAPFLFTVKVVWATYNDADPPITT